MRMTRQAATAAITLGAAGWLSLAPADPPVKASGIDAGPVVAPLPGEGEAVTLCYSINWSGFRIANLRYRYKGGQRFEVNIKTNTVGLIKMFGPLHYDAVSRGRMSFDDQPRPVQYVAAYTKSNKQRRIVELTFNQATGEIIEDIRPPRGYVRVPPEARIGAMDPLTAALHARPRLIEAVNAKRFGSEFTVPVYDGSKRYDVIVKLVGPDTRTVAGQPKLVYHVLARVKPISGFKPKQIKLLPKQVSHLYISHDDFFVPVDVGVALRFGTGGAQLTAARRGLVDCPKATGYTGAADTFGH